MARLRILLFVSALGSIIVMSNCLLDDAVGILRRAAEIEYTITVKYNPKELSLEKTILQLKKMNEKSNSKKLEMGNRALIPIEEISPALGKNQNFSEAVQILSDNVGLFDRLYKKFDNFVKSIDNSTEMKVLDNYFQEILNSSSFLEKILILMSQWSTENSLQPATDFFLLIEKHIRNFEGGYCGEGRLTQGHVWNFYNVISDMEYKGSFLLIMAYRHFIRRKLANYKHNIEEAQRNARYRLMRYFERAREAMKYAPREILGCDDGIYVKNKTYVELQGISQGFIIDPVSIKNSQNCYVPGPQDDICEHDSTLCFHRQCSQLGGKVNQCRDLTEGRNIKKLSICPAEDHEKRYSWLQLDDTFIGNHSSNQSCSKPLTNYGMVGTESHGFLFFSWSKDMEKKMCFCNCERLKWNRGDVRAISLLWNEADHYNNRVITNIKFEEINGMIHLRIQEGDLLPGGRINQSSLSWIGTPDTVPTDTFDTIPTYTYSTEKYPSKILAPGVDFAYISNELSINIDDIHIPESHVIVGIGFRQTQTENQYTSGIELEISTLECDFITGTLDKNVNYMRADMRDRKILDLGSPGNPVNMKKLSNDFSKPDEIIQFQQTDWKKDLGQSIVPFFDIRPLKHKVALPLSGISLYHRGCEDCGGFLSWKLTTVNIFENFGEYL